MDEIAVLIPCYNESKTIEKVITDFKKALPEAVIQDFEPFITHSSPRRMAVVFMPRTSEPPLSSLMA